MHDNPGDRRVDNLCRLQHKCGPSVGISCNFRENDQCETWYVTESNLCVCVHNVSCKSCNLMGGRKRVTAPRCSEMKVRVRIIRSAHRTQYPNGNLAIVGHAIP